MAVFVLVIVSALSALLVSLSLVHAKKLTRTETLLRERTALECVGEDFCSAVSAGTAESWLPGDGFFLLSRQISSDCITMAVAFEQGGEYCSSLSIELKYDGENNQYQITNWSYY